MDWSTHAIGSYPYGASNLAGELIVGIRGTKDKVAAVMGLSVLCVSRQLVGANRVALHSSLCSRLRNSHMMRIVN